MALGLPGLPPPHMWPSQHPGTAALTLDALPSVVTRCAAHMACCPTRSGTTPAAQQPLHPASPACSRVIHPDTQQDSSCTRQDIAMWQQHVGCMQLPRHSPGRRIAGGCRPGRDATPSPTTHWQHIHLCRLSHTLAAAAQRHDRVCMAAAKPCHMMPNTAQTPGFSPYRAQLLLLRAVDVSAWRGGWTTATTKHAAQRFAHW